MLSWIKPCQSDTTSVNLVVREPHHTDLEYKLLTDKAVELDVVEEREAKDDMTNRRH